MRSHFQMSSGFLEILSQVNHFWAFSIKCCLEKTFGIILSYIRENILHDTRQNIYSFSFLSSSNEITLFDAILWQWIFDNSRRVQFIWRNPSKLHIVQRSYLHSSLCMGSLCHLGVFQSGGVFNRMIHRFHGVERIQLTGCSFLPKAQMALESQLKHIKE